VDPNTLDDDAVAVPNKKGLLVSFWLVVVVVVVAGVGGDAATLVLEPDDDSSVLLCCCGDDKDTTLGRGAFFHLVRRSWNQVSESFVGVVVVVVVVAGESASFDMLLCQGAVG
jgi:hypothetical protein